jgi:uncharacterized membrane protein YesL
MPLYLVSALLIGPALASILSCITEFKKKPDISSIVKPFFRKMYHTMRKSIQYTIVLEFIGIIIFADMKFFSGHAYSKWIIPFFAGVGIFCVMLYCQAIYNYGVNNLNCFESMEKFQYLVLSVLDNSLYSLVNGLLFFIFIFLIILKPGIGLFFAPVIFSCIIIKNQDKFKLRKEMNSPKCK